MSANSEVNPILYCFKFNEVNGCLVVNRTSISEWQYVSRLDKTYIQYSPKNYNLGSYRIDLISEEKLDQLRHKKLFTFSSSKAHALEIAKHGLEANIDDLTKKLHSVQHKLKLCLNYKTEE